MRILQLISSGGFYGAEAVAASLSSELPKLGHQVVLGVFHNAHNPHLEIAERVRQDGIPLEIIPCRGRLDWAAVRAVRRCVAQHRVDVIHAHGYKSDMYGIVAARMTRVPLVATCHNWTGASVSLRLYSTVDCIVLHQAHHVVAVSQDVCNHLVQFAIPKAKITVIGNGIDTERFGAARPALREELSLGGRTIIGVVGRLSPEKGHKFLLHAAPRLIAEFPDAAFLFVGAGPEQPALESLTRQLNLWDRVFFAGFRDDMPNVYASIDVLALPSLKEGSPLALLEAMAAALPVVATDVGDVGQIVVSGESGLLVAPRNPEALCGAIGRLIADAGLRVRLAANGRRYVQEHFSATRMAQNYVDVYEDVLPDNRVLSKRAEPAAV